MCKHFQVKVSIHDSYLSSTAILKSTPEFPVASINHFQVKRVNSLIFFVICSHFQVTVCISDLYVIYNRFQAKGSITELYLFSATNLKEKLGG
jgi:hypothetical protein